MAPVILPEYINDQKRSLPGMNRSIRAVMVLLFLLLLKLSFAQEQNLKYAIHRNGKKVGELNLQKRQNGAVTSYHIESEVKVTVIMAVVVKAKEQSVYENELLQSSSLVRHVNGRQKTHKLIRNNGNGLTVTDEGSEQVLKNYSVRYSTHCLYTTEPIQFSNVFSDNYKKFLPIVKLSDHHYRLSFPDGGSNEYFYKNGVCQKVKVKNNLFSVEFLLATP